MHRIKTLNELLSLLDELSSELKTHKNEILKDEVLALQKETRHKIKVLMSKMEEMFPSLHANVVA